MTEENKIIQKINEVGDACEKKLINGTFLGNGDPSQNIDDIDEDDIDENDIFNEKYPSFDEEGEPNFDEEDPVFDDEFTENKESVLLASRKKTIDNIEYSILACLFKNRTLDSKINENIFNNPFHKYIFNAITFFALKDDKRIFDPNAVGLLLSKRTNNLKYSQEIVPALIAKFKDDDVKIEDYLTLYQDEVIREKALEIANNIILNINSNKPEYIKAAAVELNNIKLFEKKLYCTISEALDVANFEIKEAIESDSAISGVPTGIPTLDDVTGGLKKSDLVILAARPGQGKTATAINFAYHSKTVVGFISSEMPASQLAMRLLSLDSGVDAQKLRNPKKLTKAELLALKQSSDNIKKNHTILINDKPNISIQEVSEIAKEWKEKYDLGILFIDYIQRLTYVAPGSDNMMRHEKIGNVASGSKEIARELNIPVVGLAQISRGAEKNESTGGRPMLSDLKDSGMIEQEADLVICPFRENMSGMDVNTNTEMTILILKNRHGPLGEIEVLWISKNMKIIEPDYEGDEDDEEYEDEDDTNNECFY